MLFKLSLIYPDLNEHICLPIDSDSDKSFSALGLNIWNSSPQF